MSCPTNPHVALSRTPPPNDRELDLDGLCVAIGRAPAGELRYEAPVHVSTWIDTPHVAVELRLATDLARQIDQAPGSLFFVPSGTEFWTRWREESRWVQVSAAPEVVAELLRDRAAGRPDPRPALVAARDPAIDAIAALISREIRSQAPDRLYLSSLATAWLARVHGKDGSADPAIATCMPRLQTVRDYIHAHLTADLSLRALARVADLSAEHLRRSFLQVFGETPFAYVRRERVRLAEAMLARGRLSTTQIAERVGFGSRAQLHRAFLEVNGSTPGRFRRSRTISVKNDGA